MASIWSKQLAHVNAKAEVTGGSVTNVIQVARKESEMGIAMADVVTADPEAMVWEVMQEGADTVSSTASEHEVAVLFERRDLR